MGERTGRRIDAAVESTRTGMVRAQKLVSTVFSSGVLVANLVLAAVVVVGTLLGIDGTITAGKLLAFLFLVQLFTGPVQMATEILNELQNAVAGWRRVLAVVETPIQVVDKGDQGVRSPRGPARVTLEDVRFAYPDGPEVLHGVDLDFPARTSVAVVGATGSGKTTIAKLVTRLMDPTSGAVRLDGVDLRDLSAASLRERVVLVPQEGFLFDGTLAENIAYGVRDPASGAAGETPGQTAARHADRIDAAVAELGLTDWVADLPDGLGSAVGQRGEALSAGERQLVAITRAYLAGADLLVLDEATSAVDPATEVRIARALDSLTAGRSTITIAHRLSTAESADLVVVVDAGHVVEIGPHAELAAAGASTRRCTRPGSRRPDEPRTARRGAGARERRPTGRRTDRGPARAEDLAGFSGAPEHRPVRPARRRSHDPARGPRRAAQARRGRAGRRDRPAARHGRGAHARLDGRRGAAPHADDGPRHVLVALAAGVLAQGRHVGPRAVGQVRPDRLRRRRAARPCRPGRRGVPHGCPDLLRGGRGPGHRRREPPQTETSEEKTQ